MFSYKRTSHKAISIFPSRDLAGQDRREWGDIFKVMKEKYLPTKNTLPSKVVLQK